MISCMLVWELFAFGVEVMLRLCYGYNSQLLFISLPLLAITLSSISNLRHHSS